MSDEHEYICEIWISHAGRGGWLHNGEWLPAEDSTWGSREAAIDVAEAWDADGWMCRIASRRKETAA